jgi:hypothetical protein
LNAIPSTEKKFKNNLHQFQAWKFTPVIPALRRLKQEAEHEFKVSLGFIARPYFK